MFSARPVSEIQTALADMEDVVGRNFRAYANRICDFKSADEMMTLSEKYLLSCAISEQKKDKVNHL